MLDDLYSEVCPLLPFSMFNVCCDETWGLGNGPSKALADQIGVGGVYVRHIRRVHDLLQSKYGKRMMMWGDIILQHPDQLDQIGLVWPAPLSRNARPQRVEAVALRTDVPFPESARTGEGEEGFVALHNNAVRLLLGTEGAHVYRWEVAASDGRDLTMLGAGGWAGFSDLGGTARQVANTVTCLADGPA